jgi:hypothetical protein
MQSMAFGVVRRERVGSEAVYTAVGTPEQRPPWMRDRKLLPKLPPGRAPVEEPTVGPEAPIVTAEPFVRNITARKPKSEERVLEEVVRPLVTELARAAGVEPADVLGRTHRAKVVRVRHEAWRRLHAMKYSTVQIGRMFDRDHTAVMYGLRALGAKGAT